MVTPAAPAAPATATTSAANLHIEFADDSEGEGDCSDDDSEGEGDDDSDLFNEHLYDEDDGEGSDLFSDCNSPLTGHQQELAGWGRNQQLRLLQEQQRRREDGNDAILEAIQKLSSVASGIDDASAMESLAAYKTQTKTLLERLLLKLTEDTKYQRALEDQVDVLEESLMEKDLTIERLSFKAHEAIDDCKTQSEQMAVDCMAKVEEEVIARAQLEAVIRQLTRKVSTLTSENKLYKIAHKVCKNKDGPSIEERLVAYCLERESLRVRCGVLQAELTTSEANREAEINALGSVAAQFGDKLRAIQAEFRQESQIPSPRSVP